MIRPISTNPMLLASAGKSGYTVMSPTQLESLLRDSVLFKEPIKQDEAFLLAAYIDLLNPTHMLDLDSDSNFFSFAESIAPGNQRELSEPLKAYLTSNDFLKASTAEEKRTALTRLIQFLDMLEEPENRTEGREQILGGEYLIINPEKLPPKVIEGTPIGIIGGVTGRDLDTLKERVRQGIFTDPRADEPDEEE